MRFHIDPRGGLAHRSDHRPAIVLACGMVTSALALAGVFALARGGTNIMGWYANYIIPAGALAVGACAASGYGLGAWLTGLKMSRHLVIAVCALLVLSYFIAQYEQYRAFHLEMGFWSWFDAMARGFAWKHKDGTFGEPFGLAGYFFRSLEIGGFVVGGLFVPLALRAKSYCEPCRTYRRTKLVALVPAFGREPDEALAEIWKTSAAADRAAFDAAIEANGSLKHKRKVKNVSPRIAVDRVRCPRCANGSLAATKLERVGRQFKRTRLTEQPLASDAMRALFD